jgi:hypothetical protein
VVGRGRTHANSSAFSSSVRGSFDLSEGRHWVVDDPVPLAVPPKRFLRRCVDSFAVPFFFGCFVMPPPPPRGPRCLLRAPGWRLWGSRAWSAKRTNERGGGGGGGGGGAGGGGAGGGGAGDWRRSPVPFPSVCAELLQPVCQRRFVPRLREVEALAEFLESRLREVVASGRHVSVMVGGAKNAANGGLTCHGTAPRARRRPAVPGTAGPPPEDRRPSARHPAGRGRRDREEEEEEEEGVTIPWAQWAAARQKTAAWPCSGRVFRSGGR